MAKKTYKVKCKVDFGDGKGIVEHQIYIKAKDEIEAESLAKYYWLTDRWEDIDGYYGMISAKEL
jgi:hypothetical protein